MLFGQLTPIDVERRERRRERNRLAAQRSRERGKRKMDELMQVTSTCTVKLLINQTGKTVPDSAVAMSSANGLVGTGFASRYRLQLRTGF